MNEKSKRFAVLAGIVFIGIFSRLIPHIDNVVPITAIALFAGVYFLDKKWGLIIPLLALFISDGIMQLQFWAGITEYPGFHNTMLFVYGSFALIVGLGYLIKDKVNGLNLLAVTLGASAVFFLITNFGVWLTMSEATALYPKTLSGLLLCYEAGIPFALKSIFGDFIFTGILFGSFELLLRSGYGKELSPVRVKSK